MPIMVNCMKNKKFLSMVLIVISLFFVGCKLAKEEPVTETTEEIVDTGALAVESSPNLAEVYIGEEYKGDTPLNLYNLPVGAYEITLKKQGYADFKKSAAIKVGRTEEIDATLTPIVEEIEPKIEEPTKGPEKSAEAPESAPLPAQLNKINLSSFAMYYDFGKMEFTELRTTTSDLFSRKYDTYVHFTALTPTKIYVLTKPIGEVTKEDCIFADTAVAPLFSGQTLCVKTGEGAVIAIGGNWKTMPTELELKKLS